jgi:hypothetical protein
MLTYSMHNQLADELAGEGYLRVMNLFSTQGSLSRSIL